MNRSLPKVPALALAALTLCSGCAFHSTATHWNGHLGADGEPVWVLTSSYVGMNFAVVLPLSGRSSIDEMIDEATRRITAEQGSHLRLVETETNNYWYGLPPLSWLFSPVVTSISFEYRPTPAAVAAAAAADAASIEHAQPRAADNPAGPVPAR